MLCNWNTSALWGSFSHYIHLLENDGVYLRAIDLKAAGMLYGQVKSWYKTVSSLIEALKEERKQLGEYKKMNSSITSAVRYASGACCSIPSRTYSNGDLVVMDWALVKWRTTMSAATESPRRGKRSQTAHSTVRIHPQRSHKKLRCSRWADQLVTPLGNGQAWNTPRSAGAWLIARKS